MNCVGGGFLGRPRTFAGAALEGGAHLIHLVEVIKVLLRAAALGMSFQKRVNEVADGVVAGGFVAMGQKRMCEPYT